MDNQTIFNVLIGIVVSLIGFIALGFKDSVKSLNCRVDGVENEIKEVKGNYITRFEGVLAAISKMEMRIVSAIEGIKGDQRVDDEKHRALNERIVTIENEMRKAG